MQATAETAMGGGFRRNSVSELKLKNRCTGSTGEGVSTYYFAHTPQNRLQFFFKNWIKEACS